ncbi:MAG: alpha/beta hydrolase [Pseudobacteriovorax sp.]|nr:alpha/beta hydrolase [Pseudobacteriovorax sp.]
MSIYRSLQAKESLDEKTERLLTKLPVSGKEHVVETANGIGFCLELGDPNKPKLLVIHGGYTNHAFTLYYLRSLVSRFHIFALDLPGHPGKSSEAILDPRDDSYGHWAISMLRAVGLDSCYFLGVSYGAFVCQRIIALEPSFASRLVLIVPAGICAMDQWSLVKHLLMPRLLFGLTGNQRFFHHIVNHLFTDTEVDIVDFFRDVLLHIKTDSRPMKISLESEMSNFKKPVLLITADNDVVFDPTKLANQASKLFGDLTVLNLKASKHSPSFKKDERTRVCNKIVEFLEEKESIESTTEAKRSNTQ